MGGTTAGAQNSTLDSMAGINTTAGSDIYEGMSKWGVSVNHAGKLTNKLSAFFVAQKG